MVDKIDACVGYDVSVSVLRSRKVFGTKICVEDRYRSLLPGGA
jgi:hypothetical protein